ncbi:hypothetical protein [Denitratisoma oestradiolicum]|uniref:Fido domain-containing protein n=1 Tax=Denitratisoma oestradiolicum TaxID=311182 RepID=A0A6S6XVT7_9PROT|nr:hypothetical protein [Denitratisoma oestradiolicum]CAB1370164.1 protein of unknown function [Denitratisoma oestradiolicum]
MRAVLDRSIFVYIYPYMDGTGRMVRFLMNAMLASGGYPWSVPMSTTGPGIWRPSTKPARRATFSLSLNSSAGAWRAR